MSDLVGVRTRFGRFRVSATGIQRIFLPGGDVWKDAGREGWKMKARMIARAPSRTGHLASAHEGPYRSVAHNETHLTIVNTADYAQYVHEGTHGPIAPHNPSRLLLVRPTPHSWFSPNPDRTDGRIPLRSVSGQSGNPWMRDAMEQSIRLRYRP